MLLRILLIALLIFTSTIFSHVMAKDVCPPVAHVAPSPRDVTQCDQSPLLENILKAYTNAGKEINEKYILYIGFGILVALFYLCTHKEFKIKKNCLLTIFVSLLTILGLTTNYIGSLYVFSVSDDLIQGCSNSSINYDCLKYEFSKMRARHLSFFWWAQICVVLASFLFVILFSIHLVQKSCSSKEEAN